MIFRVRVFVLTGGSKSVAGVHSDVSIAVPASYYIHRSVPMLMAVLTMLIIHPEPLSSKLYLFTYDVQIPRLFG